MLLSLWLYLVLLAVGVTGVVFVLLRPDARKALVLGLFLALFDFAFENFGMVLGLWHTTGSVLQLWAVPAEVFVIALCAGFTYHALFRGQKALRVAASTSFLIAVVGTMIEAVLVSTGYLHYTGGWTSWLAVPFYWLAFMLVFHANKALK
ncbi:MAG: hypothetical protein JW834_04230 [Candidatus Diapherotrites archaeon]|nr:hypothetical protein [Candidatus Diapherotrites archaeon]